jgi:hypothetical protein
MTVVALITAVISAGLPVVVGLSLGERPSASGAGRNCRGLSAVALVSGRSGHATNTPRSVSSPAAAAGVGFGFIFVASRVTADDSGLWPLVAARLRRCLWLRSLS